MTKEELIKLIESMSIEEIKKIVIIYFKEKNYNMYDNRKQYKISVGENNEEQF